MRSLDQYALQQWQQTNSQETNLLDFISKSKGSRARAIRDAAIVAMLLQGDSNSEIASKMSLSGRHVRRIKRKINKVLNHAD